MSSCRAWVMKLSWLSAAIDKVLKGDLSRSVVLRYPLYGGGYSGFCLSTEFSPEFSWFEVPCFLFVMLLRGRELCIPVRRVSLLSCSLSLSHFLACGRVVTSIGEGSRRYLLFGG